MGPEYEGARDQQADSLLSHLSPSRLLSGSAAPSRARDGFQAEMSEALQAEMS